MIDIFSLLSSRKRLTVTQCVAHPLFSNHLSEKTLRSCLSIVPEEGALMNSAELDVHMVDLNSLLHNGISHTMDTDHGDGSSKDEEIVPSDSNSNKLITSSCDSESVSEKRRHESVEECSLEERATIGHPYEMQENHHMQMEIVTSKVEIFSHSRTSDTIAPFPKFNFERTHEEIFHFGPDQRGENSFCSPSVSPMSQRKLQVLHHGKENILMDHSPEPKRFKMDV